MSAESGRITHILSTRATAPHVSLLRHPWPASLRYTAIAFVWVLLLSITLAACGQAAEPPAPIYLRMAGSTSMRSLVEALNSAYVDQHPHVTFDWQGVGSDLGLDMLKAHQVDMAASSWPPSKDDLERLRKAGTPLKTTTIARDGLSLIVHPSNPVITLSTAQLRGIFRGRILDWREVGGRVGDVIAVSREDGSGSRKAFESLVMDGQRVTPAAVVMPSSQDALRYVASHPNAVAYVSMGEVTPNVKALAVDGIQPTPQTVHDATYPLIRLLTILTETQPQPEVQSFLDFALSSAGQDVVKARYAGVR